MQLMILSATQYEAQMKNNSTYNRILYNTKNMILSKEVEMRNSRSVFNSSSMRELNNKTEFKDANNLQNKLKSKRRLKNRRNSFVQNHSNQRLLKAYAACKNMEKLFCS